MEKRSGHAHQEAFVLVGAMAGAFYFILLGYVLNARGQGSAALISALTAVVLALLIYRLVLRSLSPR